MVFLLLAQRTGHGERIGHRHSHKLAPRRRNDCNTGQCYVPFSWILPPSHHPNHHSLALPRIFNPLSSLAKVALGLSLQLGAESTTTRSQ